MRKALYLNGDIRIDDLTAALRFLLRAGKGTVRTAPFPFTAVWSCPHEAQAAFAMGMSANSVRKLLRRSGVSRS